jgi:hypothetical protein
LLCVTFSFYIRWQFPTVKCLTRPCWHKALPSNCTAVMCVRCFCNYTKLKRIHSAVAAKIRFAIFIQNVYLAIRSFISHVRRNTNWSLGHLVPHFNPLLTEFLLYNIYEFSSYLTGNILLLHCKDQPINFVQVKLAAYFENHTKHTNTLCGQNAEI